MKQSILIFKLIILVTVSYAQGFDSEKVEFKNFIERMYKSSPFEGVRIVKDYDNEYLISAVVLDQAKYSNESIATRVAQVKAQSQASTFINGASVSMDLIILTTEVVSPSDSINYLQEKIERIKQSSKGFSQGLEILTLFNVEHNNKVYIYSRLITN